jgi:hypothetical protein
LIWYFKENKFHLILGNLGLIKDEFCVVLLMPLESFLKIMSRASKFKMGAFGNHVGYGRWSIDTIPVAVEGL